MIIKKPAGTINLVKNTSWVNLNERSRDLYLCDTAASRQRNWILVRVTFWDSPDAPHFIPKKIIFNQSQRQQST